MAHRSPAEVIQDVLDTMRFPPQVSVVCRHDFHTGDAAQTVQGRWPDSTPGATGVVTTGTFFPIDPFIVAAVLEGDTAPVVHAVYSCLRTLWLHELHEWFTVAGAHHIDPHPPGGGFR